MPYIHEFIMLTVIHLLAVMSPGPDFAIVLRQSISFGRRTAILTSIGIGAGISVHVLYTLLGIGLLISQSAYLMITAKILGAAYITYLGINLLRSKPALEEQPVIQVDSNKKHQKKAFIVGFMTNVLNPKATLFFLAIFTTVVSAKTPIAVQSIYGLWIILTTTAWFCLVSFLFSQQSVRQKFVSHGHWFDRAMGIILLLFAVKLLVELI
ncbi:LysE family translocator [Psychromonas sp. RZ22]|uniref:LysE family translocator n=1 Tax=Psychromonas algarum TaxID=2555643 RepID=UPI001067F672|nr:LysE family transporter [Psychromonas sp. RZ22]TEW55664.1 LysE family translocator [Psychromonas sp. RZ22]